MMWKCEKAPAANPIAHGAENSHRQMTRPFNLSESRTSARTSVPLASKSNGTEASQSLRRIGHILRRFVQGTSGHHRTITGFRGPKAAIAQGSGIIHRAEDRA